MKCKINFDGKIVEVDYYWSGEDEITFTYQGKEYFTHYKSMII